MDKKYPKVVVGAFIRNQAGEILLVKSSKWQGKWVVMGGHVEYGEKIADALVREVKEETDLDVTFDRIVEVVEFIDDPSFHKPAHMIALQSECHLASEPQNPVLDGRELQEYRWFSLADALKLDNLLPVTRHTLSLLS